MTTELLALVSRLYRLAHEATEAGDLELAARYVRDAQWAQTLAE